MWGVEEPNLWLCGCHYNHQVGVLFSFFFSFLTLNRSSRFPGHRLPDHCKAVHFKQWSGHDVIACNARRIQMGCLFGDFPKHPLPKSYEILVHILLLIACQKILKCSTMQNAPANSPPFYKAMSTNLKQSLWQHLWPCEFFHILATFMSRILKIIFQHSLASSWSDTGTSTHTENQTVKCTPFHFLTI